MLRILPRANDRPCLSRLVLGIKRYMESQSIPEWALIGEALRRAGSLGEPPEIHGEICGLLCVMGEDAVASWVTGTLNDAQTPTVDAVDTLTELGGAAFTVLEAGDMSISLLLPGDDDSLEVRAEALGHWCQGFMHGLGAGGQGGNDSPIIREGLTRDIILDFSEITRVMFADDETEEEGEAALIELIEYVRVSVQLVFEELLAIRGGAGSAGVH